MPVSFTFSRLEASGLWNILDGSWRLHRFPIRCVWDASTKQPEPMAGPDFSGTASWNSQGLLSNSIWPPQWISTAAPASLSYGISSKAPLSGWDRHCQHLQKITWRWGKLGLILCTKSIRGTCTLHMTYKNCGIQWLQVMTLIIQDTKTWSWRTQAAKCDILQPLRPWTSVTEGIEKNLPGWRQAKAALPMAYVT